MHPEIESLALMLDEASELLQSNDSTSWAEWLRKDAKLIRSLDFFGIKHLRSAFGGMGTFNDIVLVSRGDGDIIGTMLIAENERLAELRTSIYNLATKLAREEQS